MRTLTSLLTAFLLLTAAPPASAQTADHLLDVEIEPVAYALGGAGGHLGYQKGAWSYTVEVFTLTIPEALHGNSGFEATPLGAEFHAERSLTAGSGGFYAGPEVGLVRLQVTRPDSGTSESALHYSVGLRVGYRWYPGLGNLYLSPVAGLGYTLNASPIRIEGRAFDSSPLTPWATVGIGWSFFR